MNAPAWLNVQEDICRDPQCRCVQHGALDFELLEAYGLEPRVLHLSPTETRLLTVLLPPGRLVSRETLLERVWGPPYHGEFHLLRVNLARLRSKIRTHWRVQGFPTVGYRLSPIVGQYQT